MVAAFMKTLDSARSPNLPVRGAERNDRFAAAHEDHRALSGAPGSRSLTESSRIQVDHDAPPRASKTTGTEGLPRRLLTPNRSGSGQEVRLLDRRTAAGYDRGDDPVLLCHLTFLRLPATQPRISVHCCGTCLNGCCLHDSNMKRGTSNASGDRQARVPARGWYEEIPGGRLQPVFWGIFSHSPFFFRATGGG